MGINLLDFAGTIYNKEDCIRELRSNVKSLRNVPDTKICFRVNQSSNNTDYRYFTQDYVEVEETSNERFWMWIDSGYKNKNNDILYFQFRYSISGWTGAFVGTEQSIVAHQEKEDNKQYELKALHVEQYKDSIKAESENFYLSMLSDELDYLKSELKDNTNEISEDKNTNVKSPSEEQTNINFDVKNTQSCNEKAIKSTSTIKSVNRDADCNSVYDSIYNRLLIQSGWDEQSIHNYLIVVISRINFLLSKGEDCSKYVVYNKDNTSALINTALLDKFGKSIIIVCNIRSDNTLSFTAVQIVDGRQMLLKLGFEKDTITGMDIERVRFYNKSVSELIFSGDIDEFDFDSWDRLVHCIDERRDRFPEEYRDKPSEALCSDMMKAIELGVTLSKYDSNYIKPIYNSKFNQIHFIIPFHLGNNFRKKHELGIVIANFDNTFWQVMTILDYKSCQEDIRVLALYSDEYI